ncbi:hypothetical protein [Corynebacterium diphtheriae]|uniref:hypothetical protein n=1 Tax=Corynebacterium diphtheriae TaxID=1717 RepID=UPI000245BCAA|nr:hypothetical protein [Corynebacterium diphtheriae]AEX47182.1 20kD antigen [Corynebacterium diphtheriae INCA 402]OJI01957.1 hypothetical protein BKD75_10555 [Corynebacterium diphtheriae]VEJ66302.1 20kD antigen [Corynebacterium diphtheriae]
MFKRSLASLAAVAVASGVIVAPANAMTLTVNGNMCTIEQTAEEASYTRLKQTTMLDKEKAAFLKMQYGARHLSTFETEIAKLKQELANSDLGEERKKELTRQLEEKEKSFTANKNLREALDACIEGRNYNSKQSGVPNNPEGPSKPGPNNPEGPSKPGPNNPEGPSKPGPNNPEGPSKPGPNNPEGPSKPGPNNPEVERALPSTNGAVIGVIVAVLGILAAALPVIKSILRALLP